MRHVAATLLKTQNALDALLKVSAQLVNKTPKLVAPLKCVAKSERPLCNFLVQVFELVVVPKNLKYGAVPEKFSI